MSTLTLNKLQQRSIPLERSPANEKSISKTSLTKWETLFRPGGSKALEFNLIQLNEGSDKCNRVYLVALGYITVARSLVEAPVALGRLVIEITEWAIDFERAKSELFELIYVEVSDCLRCIKIAFIVTGLTVGGIFFPSSCFGALKNVPNTVDVLLVQKQLEVSNLHKQVKTLQLELAKAKEELDLVQANVTTEKKNLQQTLETTSKQGQSLAEAERLQDKIKKLNDIEVTLNQKLETCKTELDKLNEENASAKKVAAAELATISEKINTEKEVLDTNRTTLGTLTNEHNTLTQKGITLKENIQKLTLDEKALIQNIQREQAKITEQQAMLSYIKEEHDNLQATILQKAEIVSKDDLTYAKPIRDKVENLQKAQEELETQNQTVLKKIEEAKLELAATVKLITTNKETFAENQKALQTLTQEHKSFLTNSKTLQLQHTSNEEKLRQNIQTKQNQINQLEQSLKEKALELENLQADISKHEKTLKKLTQKKLPDLHLEVEKLKAAKEALEKKTEKDKTSEPSDLNSKKAKKLSSPSQEEQTQKQKKNKNTQVLTPPSVNPTSELRVSNATGDKEFPNKKN
jgi:chromosome segregation ATPase